MDVTNTKKPIKFGRFTEMKSKYNKKGNENTEKEEDSDINEVEKLKKELNENDLRMIEGELDNQELLLKIFDNNNVNDHVEAFFGRDCVKEDKEGESSNAEVKEIPKAEETLNEFWKKYKNFNDTVRKGNMKNLTR